MDWRYCSCIATPTIVLHAEEVANNEEDDKYYRVTQNTSRTICQAIKRGTRVKFIDMFVLENESHACYCNLVSTERRAQIAYARNFALSLLKRT